MGKMVDTILLPTDGSPRAHQAAAHAICLAKGENAALVVCYIVDIREMGEPALSSVEILIDEYEDTGQALLKGIATTAAKHDVPVETRCAHGVPAKKIAEIADEVGADIILMGERGLTHTKREGEVTRALRGKDKRVVTV